MTNLPLSAMALLAAISWGGTWTTDFDVDKSYCFLSDFSHSSPDEEDHISDRYSPMLSFFLVARAHQQPELFRDVPQEGPLMALRVLRLVGENEVVSIRFAGAEVPRRIDPDDDNGTYFRLDPPESIATLEFAIEQGRMDIHGITRSGQVIDLTIEGPALYRLPIAWEMLLACGRAIGA
ncbi:MAG: hypothetical protein RIC56_05970 [Pseudomonadales bacterium]